MIDTDLDRDYAEEDAVRAAVETERAEELAHEAIREALLDALTGLAEREQRQALRLVEEGTLPTIRARGHLGPSHLVYLARAAETAHLAARVARSVERFGGYALGAQVEYVLLDHETHAGSRSAPGGAAAREVADYAARTIRREALRVLAGTREANGLPGSGATRA